ncbi:MAG: hypothetical protein NXY59_01095 [Aigarchaeota archaeon]|nr:hypothetical protein [Candidatus Pelearchaeum maunauluense]
MSGAYKWLGGIGYILMLIPFANIIAPILVGIAWILMGRDVQRGVMIAAGVLIIIIYVVAIGVVLSPPMMLTSMLGGFVDPTALSSLFLIVGPLMIVLALLGFIAGILEIAANFSAASTLNVKWFRYAGWMRIIAIILALIFVAVMISSIMSFLREPILTQAPPTTFPIAPGVFWAMLIGLIIVALIGVIFTIIGFFSVPETPPIRGYYPPPPPTRQSSRKRLDGNSATSNIDDENVVVVGYL